VNLAGYTERRVHAGTVELHVLDWNPTGPDPVVLLHGISVQAHTWDPLAATLSSERRVIAVDLRGHGDSSWAREGYHVKSFAADVIALAGALELPRFACVGHSLGARVAIAVAGEMEGAVSRLILSDTGPEVSRAGAIYARGIVANSGDVRGFKTTAEALEHYQRLHPEWEPIFHDLHVAHQLRVNWAGRYVFKADPELFWLTGSTGAAEVPYLWEMLARVRAPTLIIRGTRSGFVDDELLERMLAVLPLGEQRSLDAGHYVPREKPQHFASTLTEFLERTAHDA
jgi:pimeloyl-ACP methyl ester carboxylesterase